ncbi:glycerol-3-phosphate responsive antiterminator [uncultured Gemmiger sp.]|uniref:glycerol-3-phosphate responsive antiterminator n=1 Tax=uncultured Gemmiger sp. TaxID=1623490 RepID=UPI0025DD8558|nr:glycerol-3-phosphate responsive antiterminator [uncultured Gemmiger sp.]
MDRTETERSTHREVCGRLMDSPVIAAVKEEAGLDAALQSECGAVFLLFGSAASAGRLVDRVRAAGKLAIVHIDLVEGLSGREAAVDTLAALCRPDGIISTRPTLVRRARHLGFLTVQRVFMLDSLALSSLPGQLGVGKPDFLEILPGIIPRVIGEVAASTTTPVIAGGLIRYKDEVMAAMRAGAAAVSTSSPAVWNM